jgi:glyoxylase-like metal-dependent hydrolase (beta-lactamase superfamily II)
MNIEIIDLDFMGREQVIASFLLLGEDGTSAALVESGPTTCLERLKAGLEDHGVSHEDVRQVFLTHIHLDHAGASGHLSELLPNATFYVHEVGYPHLVDPSKLVKSAARIYGESMDELWGEAWPDSGALFTGDVAGIRRPGQAYVRPPTPPPEIDIEAWVRSINHIREIEPASLWPTHFGSYEDVGRHLGELEQRLQDWLLFVEGRMDEGAEREEISEELRAKGDAEMLAEGADTGQSAQYDMAGDYPMLTDGLMRYATRRREKR